MMLYQDGQTEIWIWKLTLEPIQEFLGIIDKKFVWKLPNIWATIKSRIAWKSTFCDFKVNWKPNPNQAIWHFYSQKYPKIW